MEGRAPARPAEGRPAVPRRVRSHHVAGAALTLAVLAVLVVLARDDVVSAVHLLGDVHWGWATLAVATGLISLMLFAGVRLVLLRAAGGRMTVTDMIGLTFASGAIAASLPAGGVVATAYTFGQYRAAGADDGGATWALFLNGAITPGVLAALGLVGVGLAAPSGIGAVLIPIAAAVAFVAVVIAILRHPSVLVGPITLGVRAFRAIGRRPADDARDVATAVVARFAAVPITGAVLWAAGLLQLASWLVDVVCLVASIVAVGGTIPWRGLLAIFTASQLVGRIPIMPGGLGQIETGLVVGLHAAGMPVAVALATTLVFRIASQWIVVPIGWPIWWRRRARSKAHH
jgi:uncharacterized protein (TIRG00374 family)